MSIQLETIIQEVQRLKPGESINYSRDVLSLLPERYYKFYTFTAIEQIMGNVVGSSYNTIVRDYPMNDYVIFTRLAYKLPEGVQTFVDPDRRDYYIKRPDGFYELDRP